MLLRKLLLVAFLLALASASVAVWAVERVRAVDRALAVERVAQAHQTDLIRARCEANPGWFLAGPRENAPSAAVLADPDAAVLAPRPDTNPRDFEFFAYDVEMVGQSTAAPRLSQHTRARLRLTEQQVTEPFQTAAGTGVQTVITTRWDGPCAYLLFRMHPPPHQWRQRAMLFASFTGGAFLVTMLVAWPIDRRIRRLGAQMRASARTEYREPASVGGRDELSQLGFAFNEAAVDINRLHTDFRDRDADYRRFIGYLSSDAEAVLQSAMSPPDASRVVTDALPLSNVVVGSQLREMAAPPLAAVDVSAEVKAAVDEFGPLAVSRQVTLDASACDASVRAQGQPLWMKQAVRNLLMLALDRERSGGRVTVALRRGTGGFALTVTDTGANLPDDELRKLNAVRRFRGDEGRGAGLRGDIGLGLAIVHEVCHRFHLQLDFSRPVTGGLEVRLQSAG
jgi:signal transduction histidine kinase